MEGGREGGLLQDSFMFRVLMVLDEAEPRCSSVGPYQAQSQWRLPRQVFPKVASFTQFQVSALRRGYNTMNS
jgi:hypothetical protein